jgi:hypothetical protein
VGCCVENGNLGIFNRLKADTGEGLRRSLVAIAKSKDATRFLPLALQTLSN